MAWRTRDGQASDPVQDEQRRGAQPQRGVRNLAKENAAATAAIFEIQAERARIRQGGAAYLLAQNDD
jgi:hypothetical protein